MTSEEVESIVGWEDFHPFRLVLTDGEEILVRRPRKAHVSGDLVAVVGECRPKGQAAVERFRLVPVTKIALAERVDVPPKRR